MQHQRATQQSVQRTGLGRAVQCAALQIIMLVTMGELLKIRPAANANRLALPEKEK